VNLTRRAALATCLAVSVCGASRGQTPAAEVRHLPGDVTTHHSLDLPGRSLHFTATAGAIRLDDEKNAPLADLAFIAYQLDGGERTRRPVTFVFNGGPGSASGWLNVGAVGPWRIPLGGDATVPSAPPDPIPNAETWLDFTDLVFIDPAGTGYSRVLGGADEAKKGLFTIEGDIAYLTEAIRRWLDKYDRSVSPKYILGESYGGFRAPLLARVLAANQGVGVAGLLLVSPALDFGGRSAAFDPFTYATRLPSMTAAARALHEPVTRAQLADVESYSATEYLLDLTRGERDPDAVARRSARVAEFTGLDPALVRRYDGMLDNNVFRHELDRAQGRVASAYDTTISSIDPFPHETLSNVPDAVVERLRAPVSSAMVTIYETLLNWRPDSAYHLQSIAASRQWDWGHGFGANAQSVGSMRISLALDPRFSVLIAHGLFDIVTPYFATQLLLDQIPQASGGDRVRLEVYPGGHMFYTNDASRAAWREAARAVIERH
jgi:carboxypeptidase C (cathepsin A)